MMENGKRFRKKCFMASTLGVFLVFLLHSALALATDRPAADAAPAKANSVERGIVILVNFPDVRQPVNSDLVGMRFNKQLNDYVRKMSYGKASIEADVTARWYTMPHPIGHYRIFSRNLDVDKTRVRALIDDALSAAAGRLFLDQGAAELDRFRQDQGRAAWREG